MTREDINDIINAICPNDEDYEKPCISPKYLRQELEQLALDQRQWNEEPTTKNDLADNKTFYEQIVEYCNEHFLVLVEKDVWEDARKALTTKNDLGVDAVSRQEVLDLIADYDLSMGQVVRGIHALPSIAPQEPRWISVKDRLPQKGEYGDVLVTFIPPAGTLWATVMIAHYSDLMGIAKPCFHIGEVGKESFEDITPQVIAWMPLPAPFEPQESEE